MFEPNMISAYQFNATSGSTIDSFGVFDLTAIGVSRGHIGKNNFSFNLDGDNDYSTGTTTSDTSWTALSFSCWLRGNASSGGRFFYTRANTDTYFSINPDNSLIFRHTDLTTGSTVSSAGDFNDSGVFQNVFFRYNGSQVGIWIDGVEVVATDQTGTITYATNTIFMGVSTSIGNDFNGSMDECYLWDRALTDAEIILLADDTFFRVILPSPDPRITFNAPPSTNFTTSPQTILFNFTASDDSELTSVQLFINSILNETNATGINNSDYLFNITLSDGTFDVFGRAIDNATNENDTETRTYIIDGDVPQITIFSPVESFTTLAAGQTLDLNFSITDTHLDTCSFFYNFSFNLSAGNFSTQVDLAPGFDRAYNFSTDTVGSGVGDTSSDMTTTTVTGLNPTYERLSGGTASWTDPLAVPDCFGESFASNDINFFENLNQYVCLQLTDGNISIIQINGNRTFNWSYYRHPLNCTLNSSFPYTVGSNSVRVYATDLVGKTNFTTRSWNVTFIELNQSFNPTTIEGSTETFSAVVLTGPGTTIDSAEIIYNGTATLGSVSQVDNLTTLTASVIIPTVTTTTNFTFFWNVSISNPGSFNLSTQTQTVLNVNIDNCSTNNFTLFNYTMVNEADQVFIDPSENVSIEVDFSLLSQDGSSLVFNFTQEFINTNPVAICSNTNLFNGTIYRIDSTVKYSSQDRAIEYYNIRNFILNSSSSTQNVTLFDVLTSESTAFQITFKNSDFVVVENALIQVQR